MKTVQVSKDQILGQNQPPRKLFSLFQKGIDSISGVSWLSCEGSMGLIVPILDAEVMRNLKMLIDAIYTVTPTVAGLDLRSQRDLFLEGREMPVKNVIDGILIKNLLQSHIVVQKRVYNKLMEMQAQEMGSAADAVSFDDFRAELEALDMIC
eukprot:Gregarina_sp_Poly_1__10098@NODE_685_length_6767_cov_47_617910_g516_i0_p5_GENE_NODE_685_length_6767_cov_47_617910_g516_i0NODE_685_length_6767_cov_47_617910_g516_i0_p5_ORF_typecomplete_len152_score31_35CPSF_A/PF03178_15/1_3e07_NODE_685_length_6767_cov_47_617910_g516_i057796234